MGIFEYECPQGHITEKMVPLAERPDTIQCEHPSCKDEPGFTAKYVVSATPTTFRAQDRKAFKRQGR